MTDAPREPSPPEPSTLKDIDAEVPEQASLNEIGEAARKAEAGTSGDTREAIDRATAPNGEEEDA